jgi:hypothetical protein
MQMLHAQPFFRHHLQNAIFFALFRQQAHTLPHICIAYAGYALHVYDDKITSVVRTYISTLSTWLSTVLHHKTLYLPPFSFVHVENPAQKRSFPHVETRTHNSYQFITRYVFLFCKQLQIHWKMDKNVEEMSSFKTKIPFPPDDT